MRYIFDTGSFITFFDNEKGARKIGMLLNEVERGQAEGFVSAITLTELYYIYARKDAKLANDRIDAVISSRLKVIAIGGNIALRAGRYKLAPIPLADALIAATSYECKAHLIAHDKHFKELGIYVVDYK